MKYKVQFSKGWQGTWTFEAPNDIRAWETVKDYIKEHTQTVVVDINEIWELDESGNTIRKLADYEDCFSLYKIHFNNQNCIFKISQEKNDLFVWDKAKRDIKKDYKCKVDWIEEIDKVTEKQVRKLASFKELDKDRIVNKKDEKEDMEEQAIYKAYFSDGECSGPYIVNISENDTIALDMAKFKLKQHAEYDGIDVNKIKVTKVEELNENKLFEVNLVRKEEKKNRILSV
jgi:hypothetical protein